MLAVRSNLTKKMAETLAFRNAHYYVQATLFSNSRIAINSQKTNLRKICVCSHNVLTASNIDASWTKTFPECSPKYSMPDTSQHFDVCSFDQRF